MVASQYPLIVLDDGETLTVEDWKAELARLTKEIRWHEAQAQANARTAIGHKIEIGHRLIRAKEMLDHGEFLPWAKEEFGWAQPHVWRHMELARNHTRVNDLPADVSWRQIQKALRDDGAGAHEEAAVSPEPEPHEEEPEALFWAARDGLLALREAAQAQANRFGLRYHPENLTLSELQELRNRVKNAAAAVGRVAALLDGVPKGRVAIRHSTPGRPRPLGAQHLSILDALKQHQRLTSKELAPVTGIPVYVLSSRLSELTERGVIQRTGVKRGHAFEYRLAEEPQ